MFIDLGLTFSIAKNGDLVIENEVFLHLEPFRLLWERHTDKSLARKELLYVFLLTDKTRKNPIIKMDNEKQRIEKARRLASLPELWKPDEITKGAMDAYINIQKTYVPALDLVLNLERSLYQLGAQVEFIVASNSELIAAMKRQQEAATKGNVLSKELIHDTENLNKTFDILQKNSKRILEIAESLPKQLKNVDLLKQQALEQTQSAMRIYGRRAVNPRELPENAVNYGDTKNTI